MTGEVEAAGDIATGALWRTAWMLWFPGIAATLFVLLLCYLGIAD